MKMLLLAAGLLALAHLSVQQINIQVDIDTNSTTLNDNLSPELQQANLTQGYIQSVTKTELVVEKCRTGTFSRDSVTPCVSSAPLGPRHRRRGRRTT